MIFTDISHACFEGADCVVGIVAGVDFWDLSVKIFQSSSKHYVNDWKMTVKTRWNPTNTLYFLIISWLSIWCSKDAFSRNLSRIISLALSMTSSSAYRKVASSNASRFVTHLVFKHTQNDDFLNRSPSRI